MGAIISLCLFFNYPFSAKEELYSVVLTTLWEMCRNDPMEKFTDDPIQTATLESDDLNELAALYPDQWASYQQISPGAFKGSLRMAATPDLSIINDVWNQAILVRGTIPLGMRFFAGTTELDVPQRYKETVLKGGELITVANGVKIDYQTLGPFEGMGVSVSEDTVENYLTVTGRRVDWQGEREAIVPLPCGKDALALGNRWKQILACLMNPPDQNIQALEQLGKWALDEILDSVTAAGSRLLPESSHRKRLALAIRARDYLERNDTRSVTLSELCAEVQGNERTLLMGFTELMGCSPGTYHRAYRYNLARADLLDAVPGTTVTEIAMRWGFYHLGRFSTGYHKQFAETPSATLAR